MIFSSRPGCRSRQLAGALALPGIALILCLSPLQCRAQVQRVVVIKCDGLPYDVVDKFVKERDPRTGKSQLPWIDAIFYSQGARLENFYVRGMSLSAPSWSLLETGQHLQIKGNVEFDRYTLHAYDYLNFIPYVAYGVRGSRVDMPGVEVLDSLGEPIVIDAFAHNERYVTFSLFQRGPRFITFQKALENKFKRTPRELLDEWTMGFSMRDAIPQQLARELMGKLSDSRIRYLDLVLTDFDHLAHHNNDRESHLFVLKGIDSMVGQIWNAIQKAPLADETVLIMVSDHGLNTDERVYSQGFNLVKLLGTREGGGHHVITKRRPMLDYAIKSLNPFASLITTTTRDSYYLKGQSTVYPTAMLDFDGNERASVHMRDSNLNMLHILLEELQRVDLPEPIRRAATDAFFSTLQRRRSYWQNAVGQLEAELGALRGRIAEIRRLWAIQPKKFSQAELEAGRDEDVKRIYAQLDRFIGQEKEYSDYAHTMENLLNLHPENFAPQELKIESVIPKRSMGDRNDIYNLQNYVVGLAPGGLILNSNGAVDLERSFVHLDYLALLDSIRVKNNVQPGLSNKPVDMIAMSFPSSMIQAALGETGISPDAIWVYGSADKQALLLAREDDQCQLSFRYQPIKNLSETADGRINFEVSSWQPGLPLHIFEDKQLSVPEANRESWLNEWHTDVEWLRALHRTDYSNGLIGLYEELASHSVSPITKDKVQLSSDQLLLQRFVKRQRDLVEADLLVVASNHWNFDVRGFNPGGNHGSFFRISTHSTLMFAGGKKTKIPRAIAIAEPYDSLSFVPTVLALSGLLRDDSYPSQILWERGFRAFPGRLISEILPPRHETPNTAVTGASPSP
jgi:type I phosphodiesterase/nucleotide pyrophosphatase